MSERPIAGGNYVHHSSTFECVDKGIEYIPGSHANINGALFCHVEAHCNINGMQCPPYDPQKELNCVVHLLN